MPTWIEPMLAARVSKLPEGPEWKYEVKFDGYRALIFKDAARVRVLSRNSSDLSAQLAVIRDAVGALKCESCILDGEAIALAPDGRPSFQSMPLKAAHRCCYLFDLLWLNGRDLRFQPLRERRVALRKLLPKAPGVLRFSDSLPGTANQVVTAVSGLGLEGVIAKRQDSVYEAGERSGAWLKLKLLLEEEFVIGAVEPPLEKPGSLLVGNFDGRKLVFAGKVHGGLNPFNRREIGQAIADLVTDKNPFAHLPVGKSSRWGGGLTAAQLAKLVWLRPECVVEIGFTERTKSGLLRHPEFKRLRADRLAAGIAVRRRSG